MDRVFFAFYASCNDEHKLGKFLEVLRFLPKLHFQPAFLFQHVHLHQHLIHRHIRISYYLHGFFPLTDTQHANPNHCNFPTSKKFGHLRSWHLLVQVWPAIPPLLLLPLLLIPSLLEVLRLLILRVFVPRQQPFPTAEVLLFQPPNGPLLLRALLQVSHPLQGDGVGFLLLLHDDDVPLLRVLLFLLQHAYFLLLDVSALFEPLLRVVVLVLLPFSPLLERLI